MKVIRFDRFSMIFQPCHMLPSLDMAGLSTASGIGDYASKAGSSIAPHKQHGGWLRLSIVNIPLFFPSLDWF